MTHFGKKITTPVGELTLVADERSLVAVLWEKEREGRVRLPRLEAGGGHPLLSETERQLGEYFGGKRRKFDLPLQFAGSEFQNKVWRGLQAIPYGQTRSYRELADSVGSPQACRAVGAANGRNPLSIVVPCHRVIGADGKLTGFAGGMEAKAYLLELEKGDGGKVRRGE